MMIQWFPGHMAKAKKEIVAILPLVDIVFELADARIPASSQNPMLAEIIQKKPRLILLTKCDMADSTLTSAWERYFQDSGFGVLAIDAISGYNIKKIIPSAREMLKDKFNKERALGMKVRPIRAMILGIPNVGKSTLINRLVQRRAAAVGNRPGVTRAQQWIRINPNLELLDTPGILWPKFADQTVAMHLALTGAVKSEILSFVDIGEYFLDFFRQYYSKLFISRYKADLNLPNSEITARIVADRGIIQDDYYEKAFEIIINDFQNMRIGRITLDRIQISQ
ncbi:MAG: ribosome biogenesis GTPase YlqF [Bacilli bacterium]|nr:ribosome biogenesis GTPase YlqF [Bacilli bacterium]MDD4076725.1 ribosome biogenesis GTPase YlqF [Bacilli bacterium]MDD4388577.1 ribosome biogenesis GTPase YlqF [Bacilli bacterium]